jgi:hypothetical protein
MHGDERGRDAEVWLDRLALNTEPDGSSEPTE